MFSEDKLNRQAEWYITISGTNLMSASWSLILDPSPCTEAAHKSYTSYMVDTGFDELFVDGVTYPDAS